MDLVILVIVGSISGPVSELSGNESSNNWKVLNKYYINDTWTWTIEREQFLESYSDRQVPDKDRSS